MFRATAALSCPEPKAKMMSKKRMRFATVPLALEFPDEMSADVAAVLAGEYEAGYFGAGLTVVDIGANVGSFAVWAHMRWPNSTIHAYEPQPETYATLMRNVGCLPKVHCHDKAVYPDEASQLDFYSRYSGDGESGLVAYIGETFEDFAAGRIVQVPVLHPRNLPACDVLKIDVEGGEARILESMDLSGVSLILLEYQNLANYAAIQSRLSGEFVCEFEDRHPWSEILPKSGYRRDLVGDAYGRLFFVNKRLNRLTSLVGSEPGPRFNWSVEPNLLSLRQLLRALPRATARALGNRLKGLF
jgi:FkbM family methyltransferase